MDKLSISLEANDKGLKTGLEGAATAVQASSARMEAILSRLDSTISGVGKTLDRVNQKEFKPKVDADGFKSGAAGINGALDNVGGGISNVIGKFGALGAAITTIVAGGIFGKLIENVTNEAREIEQLSTQLSISLKEASELNIGLELIGASSGDYLGAVTKLNMGLRTNGDRLKELGLVTTDTSGQMLTQQQIMSNGLTLLDQYSAGYDRNQIAMELFGKGAAEVVKLQKLDSEMKEHAIKLAKDFNSVLGVDGVESVKEYNKAVYTAKFALNEMGETIGSAAMPAMKEFSGWVAVNGPAAIGVLNTAMEGTIAVVSDLVATFVGLARGVGEAMASVISIFRPASEEISDSSAIVKDAFNGLLIVTKLVFSTIRVIIEAVAGGFVATFGTIKAAAASAFEFMTNGFDGDKATAVYNKHFKAAQKAAQDHALNIAKIMRDTGAYVDDKVFGSKKSDSADTSGTTMGGSGSRKYSAKDSGSATAAADELASANRAQESILKAGFDASSSLQREHLATETAINDDAFKRELISLGTYYDRRLSIAQAGLKLEIDAKEREAASSKSAESDPAIKTASKRLELQAQTIKIEGELAVLNERYTQAAIASGRERLSAEAAVAKERLKVETDLMARLADIHDRALTDARLIAVAHDEELSAHARDTGRITEAQLLANAKQFEDQRFEIVKDAMAARLVLAGTDVAKRADINAELERLEREHALSTLKIRSAMEMESSQITRSQIASSKQALETHLGDWMSGAKSLSDSWKTMLKSLNDSFMRNAAKSVTDGAFKFLVGGEGTDTGFGKALSSLFGESKGANGLPIDAGTGAVKVTMVNGLIDVEGQAKQTAVFDRVGGVVGKVGDVVSASFNMLDKSMGGMLSSLTSAIMGMAGGAMNGAGGMISSAFSAMSGGLPSFDVGTAYVPGDMVAKIHKGERIVPAAYNKPGLDNGSSGGSRIGSVVNNFHIAGPIDARTQEQIARQASASLSRAATRFS